MPKTIKLSIFWAANAKGDKSYFRSRPAPEIARQHMAKARAILKSQGFVLDVQPAGSLDGASAPIGQELTAWTTPITHEFEMYGLLGLAKASPTALEKRLPVIFCSFGGPVTLHTNKPPFFLTISDMTLGVTASKELNQESGAFFANVHPPFVVMNTRMNAPNSSKLGALAHEIVHAAGVPHSDDQDNLMYHDADKAGETLTKAQVKTLGSGYFVV